MQRIDMTIIILTKNEELNIERCINSVKSLAKRIVVIDSASTDRTVEIARSLGAEVFEHLPFISHGNQFNWALDNIDINTTWVYRIDADEEVPEDLQNEIKQACILHANDDVTAFEMRFKIFFMGRFLYHGGAYPFRKVNIFKYGKARFNEILMRDDVMIMEGHVEKLLNDCLHYDFKDLTSWILKHNLYADCEVDTYFKQDKANEGIEMLSEDAKKRKTIKNKFYYNLPKFLRAKLYFWFRYYIQLGFLDGHAGFVYAYLQAYWYRVLIDAKITEREWNNIRLNEDTLDTH